jgi:hypothetical protein
VLEQLYSPLVVHTTAEHAELKDVARGCVTSGCARHYLGFAANQWMLFEKESPRRVKPLLYVFRVLLTGVQLMRTGVVNANLPECIAASGDARLGWIDELIALKRAGKEMETLGKRDFAHCEREYLRLRELLSGEAERSSLPAHATAVEGLRDLLLRIRLAPALTPA